MDLRCESKLHGVAVAHNVIEISCNSRFCGASSDVLVLHKFNTLTGEVISTRRYKKPKED